MGKLLKIYLWEILNLHFWCLIRQVVRAADTVVIPRLNDYLNKEWAKITWIVGTLDFWNTELFFNTKYDEKFHTYNKMNSAY
jgi:hypothetical protein